MRSVSGELRVKRLGRKMGNWRRHKQPDTPRSSPHLRAPVPWLWRRSETDSVYPASPVLRTSPPPQTARPVSHELSVDPDRDHRWGFPCCVCSPLPTCRRHYPGRSNGACSLVSVHRQRPSLCNSQVGSCNCCFRACSAFTHVTACTLAESPSDPFHRKQSCNRSVLRCSGSIIK